MLKKVSQILAVGLLLLSAAAAQQGRVYREGGNWTQELTGNLEAARNVRIKVDLGSVRVQGGSQPGISYVIHTHAYTSSEEKARREFEQYKISAYVRGDTAWIVGDWQGDSPRHFSGEASRLPWQPQF